MKDAAQAGILTRMAQGWDRFWFQPANPLTLGLIRVCAGVLVLYIHLAYTVDLWDMFGADGWLSLRRANAMRRESPWVGPARTWDGYIPSLYVPDNVPAAAGERTVRDTFFDFLGTVPDDARGRRETINWILNPDEAPIGRVPRYVRDLRAGPPEGWEPQRETDIPRQENKWQLIRFIKGLPEDRAERERILAYMKEWTFDPRQLDHRGVGYWSIWFHVTDPAWMMVTHLFILGVILCFTVGFCTRITAALSWFAAVSYIQRSSITLFGGDTMMNILLLYLTIGPAGAALSVDRWLPHWCARRRARQQGLPEPERPPLEPLVSANFAIRLIQIHFCIIYFASGTSKLLGGNWWNGTAIYYTMANYEFAPLRYAWYLGFMRWLAQHRVLWEMFMTGGSYFTIALELSLPYLVWNRRLRPVLVAASLALHTGIAALMGLVAFSLLMATMVLAFIPSEAVQRAFDQLRRMRGARQQEALPAHRHKQAAQPVPALVGAESTLPGATDSESAITEKVPARRKDTDE